jgi:hypothetical protein
MAEALRGRRPCSIRRVQRLCAALTKRLDERLAKEASAK